MPVSLRRMALSFATVCALGLGLSTSASAATVRVTVNGGLWDVSTVLGTFNSLSSTLMTQPWWGNGGLAHDFALAVGSQLGLLNGANSGPLFTYADDQANGINFAGSANLTSGNYAPATLSNARSYTYATAAPAAAPVPLPAGGALLLAGLGAVAALRRPKRRAA